MGCRARACESPTAVLRQAEAASLSVAGQNVHLGGSDELRNKEVLGTLVQLLRGAHLRDLSEFQHHDAIRQRHRLNLIMGHVDHGRAQALVQLGDFKAHLNAQCRIEIGQRLIK